MGVMANSVLMASSATRWILRMAGVGYLVEGFYRGSTGFKTSISRLIS